MALETGTYLADFVASNPVGSTDAKSQGDDHLRLIKTLLQNTFPTMAGAAWRVQAKSGAYTVLANDNMSVIRCTAALTLTVTAVATLGNQHLFLVIADGGVATIDPDGAELINGSATFAIPDQFGAIVVCDGSALHAITFPLGLLATFYDTNGNELLLLTLVASAVNHVQITNAAAGGSPLIDPAGDDTDISLRLRGKGSDPLLLGDADLAWPDVDGSADQVIKTDGAGVLTFGAGIVQAVQADIEAETNENTYVPPDLLHFAPSAAKMWAHVDRSAGTPALSSPSYNMTSVTDDGDANTIVTFATDFSTAIYAPGAASMLISHSTSIHTLAVSAFDVQVIQTNAGTANDTADFSCWAFGDQA